MHFPLHPETPGEGQTLEELFAGRDYDIDAAYRRMKGLMDAEGLDYGKRTHTYNSRLAQELGKWAESQPGGEAIHMALFRAYFVDNRNIGNPEVLMEIAREAGLPEDGAREVIEERTFEAAVDMDWAKSRQYGVTGVPTYVAERQGVVGAQPYEALEQFMDGVGAQRKE